jgi:hypothetical protein
MTTFIVIIIVNVFWGVIAAHNDWSFYQWAMVNGIYTISTVLGMGLDEIKDAINDIKWKLPD